MPDRNVTNDFIIIIGLFLLDLSQRGQTQRRVNDDAVVCVLRRLIVCREVGAPWGCRLGRWIREGDFKGI